MLPPLYYSGQQLSPIRFFENVLTSSTCSVVDFRDVVSVNQSVLRQSALLFRLEDRSESIEESRIIRIAKESSCRLSMSVICHERRREGETYTRGMINTAESRTSGLSYDCATTIDLRLQQEGEGTDLREDLIFLIESKILNLLVQLVAILQPIHSVRRGK